MNKGLLIAFEGADGAGKSTQVKLLSEYLTQSGRQVLSLKFPMYKGIFGPLIQKFLSGQMGTLDTVDPYLIALPFALERRSVADRIQKARESASIIISDRYTPSNIAQHAAKIKDPHSQEEFIHWVMTLEYQELGVPREDIVIYLDAPTEVSGANIDQRGKGRDIHERDVTYQAEVAKVYKRLASTNPHWIVIPCVDGEGKLYPPESIHTQILSALSNRLNLTRE